MALMVRETVGAGAGAGATALDEVVATVAVVTVDVVVVDEGAAVGDCPYAKVVRAQMKKARERFFTIGLDLGEMRYS
jgi:hypothetical protein